METIAIFMIIFGILIFLNSLGFFVICIYLDILEDKINELYIKCIVIDEKILLKEEE